MAIQSAEELLDVLIGEVMSICEPELVDDETKAHLCQTLRRKLRPLITARDDAIRAEGMEAAAKIAASTPCGEHGIGTHAQDSKNIAWAIRQAIRARAQPAERAKETGEGKTVAEQLAKYGVRWKP